MSFALPLGRPAVMGVLNVTPDSFSDGGHHFTPSSALRAAENMIEEGADLIDVGAESTRPGSKPVSFEEELERLAKIVPELGHRGIPFSIDTMKPEVARFALSHGAVLVNDVGGLRLPDMRELVAGAGCGVCIMHMQGEPPTMQVEPRYDDVVAEVSSYLLAQAGWALSVGIERDRIWIDPGIGFGKSDVHNLALLGAVDQLSALGFPVLIGVSRKGFLGRLVGSRQEPAPIGDRLPGSLAAQVIAQMKGARIIRTHDVKETLSAIKVAQAILG